MWLIVGLGNPGARYEETRHNAGFLVVERLASRWSIDVSQKLFGALVGAGQVAGHKVAMAMPQSFMNLSGQPTRSVMGFYKIPAERVLVVHDELDIPFGDVRLKVGGGHGGHNGLRDLGAQLGGPGFPRVRVGIGRPPAGWDTADYVLGRWNPTERDSLGAVLDTAADAVEAVLKDGVQLAMNQINARVKPPKPSVLPGSSLLSLAVLAAGVV
jgi:PTH1 family peptidyl-tRNA hydrolase